MYTVHWITCTLLQERDDEFAMEASVREAKTEHKVPSPSNVNIMLAPSETKPFTRSVSHVSALTGISSFTTCHLFYT